MFVFQSSTLQLCIILYLPIIVDPYNWTIEGKLIHLQGAVTLSDCLPPF